jgi:membrane-bound metal-dependent hydrolase YbcI (DUF457 family)
MPQNGIHAMAGVAVRRWMPQREWLLLGVVLGNMVPDLDNLAVAYATLSGGDSHGLHRTFTHSLFTILTVLVGFYLVAALTRNWKWNNLGIGLGIGILMHILLDLVLWFNGVELFWPIRYELNFWRGFETPGISGVRIVFPPVGLACQAAAYGHGPPQLDPNLDVHTVFAFCDLYSALLRSRKGGASLHGLRGVVSFVCSCRGCHHRTDEDDGRNPPVTGKMSWWGQVGFETNLFESSAVAGPLLFYNLPEFMRALRRLVWGRNLVV